MNNKRDLANFTNNASGRLLEVGVINQKERILKEIPPQYASNHLNRLVHIHDLEYFETAPNCIGLSVKSLIGEKNLQFNKALREVFRASIALTNQQSGGIGFLDFDEDMSVYLQNESFDFVVQEFNEFYKDLNASTRKGCEKPYVTFNIGLSTSENGRLISKAMIEAYRMGDDNGVPFIFPNIVFKVCKEINLFSTSVNHDIFKMALECTAERMVPTYLNCDSSSNASVDPKKIGIMGCRTRVVDNIYGEKSGFNRGNIASVTINLPQIAYKHVNDIEGFMRDLRKVMEEAKGLLLYRFEKLNENVDTSFWFDRGLYKDSEKNDSVYMFRNGTLSIGFIGLWDALSIITSVKWNNSSIMREYYGEAYNIVATMRTIVDKYKEQYAMNFSLIGSAAEGVTGRFASYDAKNEENTYCVADKGYYSNSFHIPVSTKCHYVEKIDIESKFHQLCNGGSITYIELDEIPTGNIEAIQEIVEYAMSTDINYFGINFPLDSCNECGMIGKIATSCPRCGCNNVQKLRRISGYLSPIDKFVSGKKYELFDRTGHMKK